MNVILIYIYICVLLYIIYIYYVQVETLKKLEGFVLNDVCLETLKWAGAGDGWTGGREKVGVCHHPWFQGYYYFTSLQNSQQKYTMMQIDSQWIGWCSIYANLGGICSIRLKAPKGTDMYIHTPLETNMTLENHHFQ